MTRTRTNIEIADEELEVVMRRYGLRTKTEAVDLALRHLAGQPMTRDEALAMRGRQAIGEVPSDTGPADTGCTDTGCTDTGSPSNERVG